jgi:glycosyltransferase involved in cell wall biosynthesis
LLSNPDTSPVDAREPMPRLLIETTALARPGRERGLGRYVRACVAGASARGYELTELRVRGRGGRVAEFLDLAERAAGSLSRRPDVFHITHPHVWGPARCPTVASILDVIALDLDEYSQTGIKTKFFLSLAARARIVLTLSDFTADRIVERLGVKRSQIVVAPLFASAAFHVDRPPSGSRTASSDYVLTVVDMATPDPRKRPGWIAPIARLLRRAGIELLVAGSGTDGRHAGMGDAVGLGRVSDSHLARLAGDAVCFLYFSAYEGQGLPPLEAMAAGAAVVATSNTAITDVVGNAGILIDEAVGSWDEAIRESHAAEVTRQRLVDACVSLARDQSLRTNFQERGRRQAALFSRERFVHGLHTAYRSAICG